MEQRTNRLFKQLAFLGYGLFEIKRIVQDAAGSDDIDQVDITPALEKYVMLGSAYLNLYSK
ncbi:MAG: hypothetical protein H6Q66_818 [Firmicutes bacterium]|nr:hypothetical protein [Bacillota bacterium]